MTDGDLLDECSPGVFPKRFFEDDQEDITTASPFQEGLGERQGTAVGNAPRGVGQDPPIGRRLWILPRLAETTGKRGTPRHVQRERIQGLTLHKAQGLGIIQQKLGCGSAAIAA